jgi:peptidoglycan-N-acetylmuramic acid deacetylase
VNNCTPDRDTKSKKEFSMSYFKYFLFLLFLSLYLTGCSSADKAVFYPYETYTATEPETISKEELSSLDNSEQNWGQGVQFDEFNRPISCVEFEEKYSDLNAKFLDGDSTEKTITLTFDEGYENGYTGQILDVLKEKEISAIFFVTLPYAKENPELIKRMIDEGHIVGNHTASHPSMPSLTPEEQTEEVFKLHDYIKENFNYEMTLFRYPAGTFSQQSLAVIKNAGYTSMFWSFAYADWDPDKQMEESQALTKLVERLHPGAIYLLHAVSSTNTHILGNFIEQTKQQGYTFS